MRILEAVEGCFITGTAAAALSSARALGARGHEIIWLAEPGSRVALRGTEAGFRTVEQLSHSAAALLVNARAIRALAAEADAVHVHRSGPHAAALLALGRSRRRRPLVRTWHAGLPGRMGFLARRLLSRAERVVARSQALAFDLRQALPPEQLAVIPGGVDPQAFRPGLDGSGVRARLGLAGRVVVGMVSRLKAGRGLLAFLEAAELLCRRPECERLAFVILGKGEAGPALERWIRGKKLEARVKIDDPRKEFMAAMAMFDVGVLLSPGTDGSARAALEMAAMAKPLVAGRSGALLDFLGDDGRIGRLVEPGAPAEIAAAVAELGADEGLRARLGLAGRERVEREFSLSRLGERYEALFQSVTGPQP